MATNCSSDFWPGHQNGHTFSILSNFDRPKLVAGLPTIYLLVITSIVFLIKSKLTQSNQFRAKSDSSKQFQNFPPGPRSAFEILELYWRWTFTGNKSAGQPPSHSALEQKYGKVLGICCSFFRGVLVSDVKVLKELTNNPAINGRPPIRTLQMHQDGKNRGMVAQSGENWKIIRQFTAGQLKNSGIGGRGLTHAIAFEAEELLSRVRAKGLTRGINTQQLFNIPAFNILWQIIMSGQRFSPDDPEPSQLVKSIESVSAGWAPNLLICHLPRLAPFIIPLLGIKNPFPAFNRLFLRFTSTVVDRRVTAMRRDSSGRSKSPHDPGHGDFISAFLRKIEETQDEGSPFFGQLGYENLKETIRDLFVAGTETSGGALSWAFLYLALNPEKQEKLQREIERVCGDRSPTLYDKPRMKYAEAVINETLRMSSNVPLGIYHATTEDTTIGNYAVPKNTTVAVNAWALHHSSEIWGDPHVFRPERFLSADESALVKHEAFVPFGFGKRICPSRDLAKDEMFVFITTFCQQLTISLNPEEPRPSTSPTPGVSLIPPPHLLFFQERRKNL